MLSLPFIVKFHSNKVRTPQYVSMAILGPFKSAGINIAQSSSAALRGFKDDPLGTLKRGVDNGQQVPLTKTKTSYSLTIHAKVGSKRGQIGAIHEVATHQDLKVDEEFEVNSLAQGLPRELVPQTVGGRTLTLQRYDLYTQNMEQIFGSPELVTLADQQGSISLRLMWKAPEVNSVAAVLQSTPQMKIYEYCDCYITSLGRTISTGNVIVGANATLVYRNIRVIQ